MLLLAKFLPSNRGKYTPVVTNGQVIVRNKGLTTATITWVYDGTTYTDTIERGQVLYMSQEVPVGKKVSTVYESITASYEGGHTVTFNVDKTATILTMFECTDLIVGPDEVAVTVYSNLPQEVEVSIASVDSTYTETITLQQYGEINLKLPVDVGAALNTVYSSITASWDGDIHFVADLTETAPEDPGFDCTIPITEQGTFYTVTLDMNGATLTENATGDEVDLGFPKIVASTEELVDPVGKILYGPSASDYTFTADPGDHAADGQYGYHNGFTYNSGTELYDFPNPPTSDVALVEHTTYGYWTGFSCDCYDASIGYPGCSSISNKAGATTQYKWDDIVNALHEKYPTRELVKVWLDGTKTTEVQFSTQTVDFVEAVWSEPVVPSTLSNEYLYLETQEIE